MTPTPRLTPTQKRLMEMLRDGRPHTRDELMPCLQDDQASITTLQMHISNLRTALRPTGVEVLGLWDRAQKAHTYRLVSLVVLNGSVKEVIPSPEPTRPDRV